LQLLTKLQISIALKIGEVALFRKDFSFGLRQPHYFGTLEADNDERLMHRPRIVAFLKNENKKGCPGIVIF